MRTGGMKAPAGWRHRSNNPGAVSDQASEGEPQGKVLVEKRSCSASGVGPIVHPGHTVTEPAGESQRLARILPFAFSPAINRNCH